MPRSRVWEKLNPIHSTRYQHLPSGLTVEWDLEENVWRIVGHPEGHASRRAAGEHIARTGIRAEAADVHP